MIHTKATLINKCTRHFMACVQESESIHRGKIYPKSYNPKKSRVLNTRLHNPLQNSVKIFETYDFLVISVFHITRVVCCYSKQCHAHQRNRRCYGQRSNESKQKTNEASEADKNLK